LFALPALGRYQLLVSHPQQIREMATTSMGVLSLNAALTDVSNRVLFIVVEDIGMALKC
jgi:hypothetical protein